MLLALEVDLDLCPVDQRHEIAVRVLPAQRSLCPLGGEDGGGATDGVRLEGRREPRAQAPARVGGDEYQTFKDFVEQRPCDARRRQGLRRMSTALVAGLQLRDQVCFDTLFWTVKVTHG